MSRLDESTRGGRAGMLIGILGLLFVLYALSPGPIIFLLESTSEVIPETIEPVLEPALETYFLPLQYAYDKLKPVEQFYDWYLDLLGTG